VGLVLGVRGLKIGEPEYAKIAIILSILGLLEYVLLYYIFALMFGMGM
jgi:hypothetical protein